MGEFGALGGSCDQGPNKSFYCVFIFTVCGHNVGMLMAGEDCSDFPLNYPMLLTEGNWVEKEILLNCIFFSPQQCPWEGLKGFKGHPF